MAISEAYANTATISTTEYSLINNSTSLATDANDGIYQIFIDTSAMISGDEYLIKVKEKILSAGSQLVIYEASLVGKQTLPFVTPTLIFMHGWDATMTQITGTARSISWSIRKVA